MESQAAFFARCSAQAETFVAKIGDQHQDAGDGVEAVHPPNRAYRQSAHVQPIEDIAEVVQEDIAQAVGAQIPGFERLQQHGEIAADEEQRRNAPGDELYALKFHRCTLLSDLPYHS